MTRHRERSAPRQRTTASAGDDTAPAWRKRNRARRPAPATPSRRLDGAEDSRHAPDRPAVRRQRPNQEDTFRCRHCHTLVGPVPSGGRHRNHCPVCLYSRHVDDRSAGDRASPCGGSMAPVGVFTQRNGEQSLVHRCLSCGAVRHNRIAADDDYDLVLALPDLTHDPAGDGDN